MNDKCYIITFKNPSDVTALTAEIKKYGTWARITEYTWAVVTTQTATNIRDNLGTYFTTQGRLFVIKSGIEAAWKNVECSSEWLKKNL